MVTARIAGFSPGTSPPPVRIPMTPFLELLFVMLTRLFYKNPNTTQPNSNSLAALGGIARSPQEGDVVGARVLTQPCCEISPIPAKSAPVKSAQRRLPARSRSRDTTLPERALRCW